MNEWKWKNNGKIMENNGKIMNEWKWKINGKIMEK